MSILVIRFSPSGIKLAESKPCKYCLVRIRNSGIKLVHYSTRNGDIKSEKTKHMNY